MANVFGVSGMGAYNANTGTESVANTEVVCVLTRKTGAKDTSCSWMHQQ